MKKGLVFLSLLLPPLISLSLSPPVGAANEPLNWSGSAELGVIFTRGNTETSSAKGRIDLAQDLENWTNEYALSGLLQEDEVTDETSGEEETEKTAEKYSAYAKANYKLEREHTKLYAYASHTDDKFAGVTKNTTVAFGYGRRLLQTQKTWLDADIGPGYSFGEQADGEDIDDAIVRISAKYQWNITDNAVFIQKLSTEVGEDNQRTLAETSLATKINSTFQMKIGLVVTHNADVPVDTEKTDTETTVTLVYSF